jgi:hypothetical protein
MSIEGLWTGELYGLQGWENSGVIVFDSGRALGGGRHHFSVGTYDVSGNDVRVTVDLEYHGTPRTLFGSSERKISLEFVGQAADSVIEGSVSRPESPKHSLMFRLTKRADLA